MPTFVKKVSSMEEEVFENFSSIQFGHINLNKNKAFKELLAKKVTIKNPKVMIYISGLNKIRFFNNIDDVLDSIEDLTAGEIEDVRTPKDLNIQFVHFKKFSDDVKAINTYLVPDYVSLFTVIFLKNLDFRFSLRLSRFSS